MEIVIALASATKSPARFGVGQGLHYFLFERALADGCDLANLLAGYCTSRQPFVTRDEAASLDPPRYRHRPAASAGRLTLSADAPIVAVTASS